MRPYTVTDLAITSRLDTPKETAAMLGRTISGLSKLRISDPDFPQPIRFGDTKRGRVYFVRSEVAAYLVAKMEART